MEIKDYIFDPLGRQAAVKRLRSDGDESSTVLSKYETPKWKKSKTSLDNQSPVTTVHQVEPKLINEFSESGTHHAKVFTASLTLNDSVKEDFSQDDVNIINTFDTFCPNGSPRAQVFTAFLTLDGQTYSATGLTKESAEANVAKVALQCCSQLENSAAVFNNSTAMGVKEDFSQDDVDIINRFDTSFPNDIQGRRNENRLTEQNNPKASSSSPTHILNRLRPGLIYEIIKEEGKPHERIFTAQVIIDGSVYEGSGLTKNLAKHAAAYEALKVHFISPVPAVIPLSSTGVSKSPEKSTEFGDYVSRLIESTYRNIMREHHDTISQYKMLAGVVMTQGTGQEAVVICVTSGTKCISGGNLSLEGETLNDCHAEILARRCLVQFFYDQLQTFKINSSNSIFEAGSCGRLKLKKDIFFHLYVSSSPCGDSRIFTLNDKTSGNRSVRDPHPRRLGRGVLRTKIEWGVGTVPVFTPIQTWDGIMYGERLQTMSCSDKLARWNVVGLQGSLLSHIIEPIYLTTLIVGSLFHRDHLERAVIGRIEHIQELPAPFRLTRPFLVTTSTPSARLPAKSPRHSVCWTVGWSEAEIVDMSRGRLLDGSISRLSKMRLFERFLRLVSLDSVWRTRIDDCIQNGFVSYGAVKAASKSFVEAKEMLKQAFITAKLGHWIKKPLEQNYFALQVLTVADTGDSTDN